MASIPPKLSLSPLRAYLFFGLLLCLASSPCQAGIYEEYSIKAAFIYKFTRYIEWPAQAFASDKTPLRLCVYGENPFGKTLRELQSKRVKKRSLEIQHIQRIEKISHCHILFVGVSNQLELPKILARIDSASIVTIGDTHYFTRHGGMIGLRLLQGKVHLDINLSAVRATDLRFSSKLLGVANIVESDE